MIKTLLASKTLFLLLITLTFSPVFLPTNVNASHLMGGEITAAHVGGMDYEFSLVLYRDINGIAIPQSATFSVMGTGGSGSITAVLDTSFYDTTTTAGGVVIGFEAAYYKSGTYTFPSIGAYNISWNSCCRNTVILNCMNPGAQSMFLETTLTVTSTSNSTPVYLAPPVAYAQLDSMWQHNPMPFDVDGDSLVWSIDTPWTASNMVVPGFVTPSAHPGGMFSVNQFTGEITWTPNMLGNYITAILVEEYRAGVKIGEIRRDMQFLVVNDTSLSSPRIGNFNTLPTDANGNARVILPPGSAYNLTLNATDAQNNTINFTSFGEPYMLLSNPASFVSSSPIPGMASGTFTWTPIVSQARLAPYIVSFRVSDGLMAMDESLLIEVGNFTSIQNANANTIGNSFPNPTQNIFFVPFELDNNATVNFELYDILGNKVADDVYKNYFAGEHLEKFNVNLPNGNYFMRISVDGKLLARKKIVVSN